MRCADLFARSEAPEPAREPFAEGGFHGVLAIGAVVLGGAVLFLIAMYLGRAPAGPTAYVTAVASSSATAAVPAPSTAPSR